MGNYKTAHLMEMQASFKCTFFKNMESFQGKIGSVIKKFRKSTIQSEAEVRSKFVVPLLEALDYPSELRAEEFNVYGYAGREKLRAKPADFIIFKNFCCLVKCLFYSILLKCC